MDIYDSSSKPKNIYKSKNVLFKLSVFITVDIPHTKAYDTLFSLLHNTDYLYSYRILLQSENEMIIGWQVDCLISQTNKYNTISVADAILNILTIIEESLAVRQKRYLIGFAQPPLELLLQLYEPLINKLATIEHQHWKQLEFDDLCQLCRCSIVTLYNQGYFIHKNLIRVTFIRSVLMELRRQGNEYNTVSLYNLDKNDREYIESLEDTSVQDEFQEILEGPQDYIDKRKKIVIDMIGERQYSQIVREYRTNCTTNSTRKLVNKLKNKLKNKLFGGE